MCLLNSSIEVRRLSGVCRQQLKLTVYSEAEDISQLLENMAVDVLASGKVNLPSAIEKDIDAVTLESVNKVC